MTKPRTPESRNRKALDVDLPPLNATIPEDPIVPLKEDSTASHPGKVKLDVDVDATKFHQAMDDALSALDVEALSSLILSANSVAGLVRVGDGAAEKLARYLVAHGVRASGAASNVLGREQRARAAALHIARELLGPVGASLDRVDRYQTLAEWIINGRWTLIDEMPEAAYSDELRPPPDTTWLGMEKG